MEIVDPRLLSKEEKKYLIDHYSAEFAYVLSKKINQPIYESKRGNNLKYFVEYFNIEGVHDFTVLDLNRSLSTNKVKNYVNVNLNKDDLDYDKIDFFKNLLKNVLKLKINKKVGDYSFELYENDIYTTDLPFRRDILVVRRENEVIGTAYISGLIIELNKLNSLKVETGQNIVNSNSDCKRISKKEECPITVLNNYLSEFYDHSFIDSIYIKDIYRGNGLGSEIYEFLFRFYNKNGKVNLTSCIKDIQTPEAKKLWGRLAKKFPNNFHDSDEFVYLLFNK